MEHLDSIWSLNEKQLKISGFNPFEVSSLDGLVNEDIWKRDVVVAESGFIDAIKECRGKNPLNVFVGYAPRKPHLGYLIMNRLLRSLRNNLSSNLILGVNIRESMQTHHKSLEETLQANELVERVLLGNNEENLTRIYDISHLNEDSVQQSYEELYSKVSKELTPFDFKKTMGWDEKTPLFQYKDICRAISGMLYSGIKNDNSSSISFTDIKHLPLVRLTKIVAKKISVKEPSFLITRILPSLTNEEVRMSSTGGDSTLYLFEGDEELNKYLKVKSGGKAKEEQKIYGGNPSSCLALKIATSIIPSEEINKTVYECTAGIRDSCRDCKRIMANYINQEMNDL
ncbi:MAG: hypothetical protein Q8P15_01655 [Nanoarchaeota archaeon]|nr:hypothetical protein [Nanoarchaeota archaeon]